MSVFVKYRHFLKLILVQISTEKPIPFLQVIHGPTVHHEVCRIIKRAVCVDKDSSSVSSSNINVGKTTICVRWRQSCHFVSYPKSSQGIRIATQELSTVFVIRQSVCCPCSGVRASILAGTRATRAAPLSPANTAPPPIWWSPATDATTPSRGFVYTA